MKKDVSTGELGRWGERMAARHYRAEGYRIVAQNWRVIHKEIDLVVENQDYIVFVEVKTRTSSFLRPAAAVTRDKQRLLINAARSYLRQHPTEKQPRFDVVEIYAEVNPRRRWFSPKFKMQKITVIRNAFGLS